LRCRLLRAAGQNAGGEHQFVATAGANETGHIALNDVPPGDYLAFAWEEVEDGVWFDADFVKAAQDHAIKVQVGLKANEEILLKLLPAPK
jgi:hypothetical protein